MGIKHTFLSPKADGPDASVVRPSDWNADHVIGDGTMTLNASASVGTVNLGSLTALTLGTTFDGNYGHNFDFGSSGFPFLIAKGSDPGDGGPSYVTYHNSASPAVDDHYGAIYFYGNNSSAGLVQYSFIDNQIVDPTPASEDAKMLFNVKSGGSDITALTLSPGAQIGSPTGGDKGTGTVNTATGYYLNNILVRKPLGVDTTFYISPTGNDSTGAGTLASPWLTLQKAYDSFKAYDIYGKKGTIQCADGTYSLPASGFHLYIPDDLVGAGHSNNAGIRIVGNTSDYTQVVFDNTGGSSSVVNLQGRLSLFINGITIRNASNSQGAINVQGPGSWVEVGTVGFIDCNKCFDLGYQATVTTGSITSLHFTGTFSRLVYVEQAGSIFDGNGGTFTFHSTPTITDVAFDCFEGSVIHFSGNPTFVGNITGSPARVGGHFKSDSFDFTTLGNGIIYTHPHGSYNLAPLGGIGYSSINAGIGLTAGAGGTVNQAGSKSAAVTLNKPTGRITTTADALGANTTVSFTLNNSRITDSDVLVLNHVSGGTGGSYTLNAQCGNGLAVINLRNVTSGALSDFVAIQFCLIKGAQS